MQVHLLVSVSFSPRVVHGARRGERNVSLRSAKDESSVSRLRGWSRHASDTLWAGVGLADAQRNLSAENTRAGQGWANTCGKRTICQKHVICTNLMVSGEPA